MKPWLTVVLLTVKNKQGCGVSLSMFPHGSTKKKVHQQWIVKVERVENIGTGYRHKKVVISEKGVRIFREYNPCPRIFVGLKLKPDAVPTISHTKTETSRTERETFHKQENRHVNK